MPLAIIKADDFIPGRHVSRWAAFCDLLAAHEAPASIGLIGGLAEDPDGECDRYADQVAAIREKTGSEFFNHGFLHRRDEFREANRQTQRKSLERCQAFARQIGLGLRAFGAPYNCYDDSTLALLDEMGEFDVVYHAESDRSFFPISRRIFVSIENRERSYNPDVRRFRRRMDASLEQGQSEFVLQIHPWRWNAQGLRSFERILALLVELGLTVVTAAKYRCMRMEPPSAPDDRLADWRELMSSAVNRRIDRMLEEEKENKWLARPFFGSRYSRGVEEWIEKVDALDLGVADSGAGVRMVDVGAGIGQWSVGFSLHYPQARVSAVEPNADLAALCTRQLVGNALEERIAVRTEPVEEVRLDRDAYDVILVPGVLMYTDHERTLECLAEAAQPGARMYVVYHQDGHHYMRTLESLSTEPDLRAVRGWSRTHVAIHQYRLGLISTYNNNQRCLRRERLERLAAAFGFRLLRNPRVWDAEPRDFHGVESFSEHLFEYAPDVGVSLDRHAPPYAPNVLADLVDAGLGRRVWRYLVDRGLQKNPDYLDCYVRSSIRAGEVLSVSPRQLASEGVSDASRLLYALASGDLEAGGHLVERAEVEEDERVFLRCCVLRGGGRPSDVYPVARRAVERLCSDSHYLWSMLFYLGARLDDLKPLQRDRQDWLQAFGTG